MLAVAQAASDFAQSDLASFAAKNKVSTSNAPALVGVTVKRTSDKQNKKAMKAAKKVNHLLLLL